jgi:hypothetical protein
LTSVRLRRGSLLLLLVFITVGGGLASRRDPSVLPGFVAAYAGDTLWATTVFWLLALVFRRAPTRSLAIAALSIAVAVEISQLYHAPWIDALRANAVGALVLGYGFLWSDLACYAAGVALAAAIDAAIVKGK